MLVILHNETLKVVEKYTGDLRDKNLHKLLEKYALPKTPIDMDYSNILNPENDPNVTQLSTTKEIEDLVKSTEKMIILHFFKGKKQWPFLVRIVKALG